MNQTAFKTAGTCVSELDPRKHVKFTQGMVLGVEDFEQDFAYQANRLQMLARETIGYGTLSGLQVEVSPSGADWKISVAPGIALSPRGQFIRVPAAQCALLKAWWELPETKARFAELEKAELWHCGDTVRAYVVLRYRDCPTDQLPVPGEPCRCESETLVASRITDDYQLEILMRPPPQVEEDAIRAFVQWLWQVEVADFPTEQRDLDYFLDALRNAALDPLGSPAPEEGAFFNGPPPENLRIPRKYLCEWMRAAMRVWVTELRPLWQERWKYAPNPCGCDCDGDCGPGCLGAKSSKAPADRRESLLLAELLLTVDKGAITQVDIDEEQRPFVIHLRMLRELMHCGPRCGCNEARAFATVFAVDTTKLQITIHHPKPLDFLEEALELKLDEKQITGFTIAEDHELKNVFYIELPDDLPYQLEKEGGDVPADEEGEDSSPEEQPAYADGALPLRYPHCPVDVVKAIELIFDTSQIYEQAGESEEGRTLREVIWQDDLGYLDYDEPSLRVFGVANFGLDGEVTGWLGRTRIAALLGKRLLGTPREGDFLQFNGKEWHPAPSLAPDKHFVELPPAQGRYAIVAAGTMHGHGTVTAYNGLKIDIKPHSLLITYGQSSPGNPEDGYCMPGKGHVYVVKGTWIGQHAEPFHVLEFTDKGISIGRPAAYENNLQFMVEISVFWSGSKPRKTTRQYPTP